MATLLEKLPLPERRRELLDACCRLLDQEVQRKKGIASLAVKAGYTVLKALKPGAVRESVDALLDDFIDALEVFHTDFLAASGAGSFGGYLKTRASEIAEALVQVTDRRAERSRHQVLKKAYQRLRSTAVRNVQEAIPGLAGLMDAHYRA